MDTTLIQIKVGQNKIVIVKNILYVKYAIGIASFSITICIVHNSLLELNSGVSNVDELFIPVTLYEFIAFCISGL